MAKSADNSGTRIGESATKAPSIENLRLNGIMIYDNNKDVNTFGLYSYTATAPVQRKALQLIPRISASGGAVVAGSKLYVYDYAVDYGYVSSANYITYDLATGTQLNKKSMGYELYPTYHNAATAVATDPTDNTVYCCSYYYNESTKGLSYNLSTWNLEGMTKDSIAPLDAPMRVMACAADGTLYGIKASTSSTTNNGGMLVKIDKKTGEITKIGDTGVRPKYFQSAVINTDTNHFYWFANEEDESANLYDVDLTTGTAQKIGALPVGDQVVAAYLPAAEAADLAPSAATNLQLAFTDGALSGTVSFDLPSKTYNGGELTGETSYKIIDGATLIGEGTGASGSHVSKDVTVSEDGMHTISVTLANKEGDSPQIEAKQYIGYDTPLAVENVTLTRTDKANTLTWTAPTGTVNGGYMNTDELKYKITRKPSGTVVAEAQSGLTFEETLDADELSLCYYEVAAVNKQFTGEATASNSVTVGDAFTPPYTQSFDDENSTGLFTIINANGDSRTWAYYSKTVRYSGSYSSAADDWLITPPMKLKAGCSYTLSYKVYGANARYTNKLEVKMGGEATVDGMSVTLKEETAYSNTSATATQESVKITPDADGVYYIGFHITSDKGMSNLTLDDLSISAPSSNAVPAAATDLTVTPDAKGTLTADISFTSPSTTAGGEALEELTKIELLRNGESIKVFTPKNATAQTYSYTDNVTESGTYIYSVICSNSHGDGEAAADTAYVGIDKPLNPASVKLKEQADGTVILSWDMATSVGANGGFVDVAAVKYNIYDASGNAVASSVSGTSKVFEGLNDEGEQTMASYSVEAENSIGKSSQKTPSNSILIGKPYDLPYAETFANAAYVNEPWTSETISGKSYDSKWNPRSDQDYNGDGGSADFGGYAIGASSRLASPKVNIAEANKPYLSFYALIPQEGAKVTVLLSANDGEWKEIKQLDTTTEWTRYSIDLAQYKSKGLRLAFLGECVKDYTFAYIDDIEIKDVPANDIAVTGINGPYKAHPGVDMTYTISLQNNGANDAEGLTVNLCDELGNTLTSATAEK